MTTDVTRQLIKGLIKEKVITCNLEDNTIHIKSDTNSVTLSNRNSFSGIESILQEYKGETEYLISSDIIDLDYNIVKIIKFDCNLFAQMSINIILNYTFDTLINLREEYDIYSIIYRLVKNKNDYMLTVEIPNDIALNMINIKLKEC